jgi:hypothetical protein
LRLAPCDNTPLLPRFTVQGTELKIAGFERETSSNNILNNIPLETERTLLALQRWDANSNKLGGWVRTADLHREGSVLQKKLGLLNYGNELKTRLCIGFHCLIGLIDQDWPGGILSDANNKEQRENRSQHQRERKANGKWQLPAPA